MGTAVRVPLRDRREDVDEVVEVADTSLSDDSKSECESLKSIPESSLGGEM